MKNTYGDLINKWANHYGVDPNLIAAIIMQESRGNPNVVSSKGAKGLMQIMTKFHKIDDPFDPNQNIQTGTKFLSRLLKLYNGNKSKALAAYNCGEGCVAKRWPNNLPTETQKYIEEVPMWENQCAGGDGTEGLSVFNPLFASIIIKNSFLNASH
jgi:soluble lytic murein transglycosylase-like protein